MAYEIIRSKRVEGCDHGDYAVVVKLEDGRMAAGVAWSLENAILIAVKNAEEV